MRRSLKIYLDFGRVSSDKVVDKLAFRRMHASVRAGARFLLQLTRTWLVAYWYSQGLLTNISTILQEKAKELRLKEFMEQQLENKDIQLEKVAARQREVSVDCKRS